MSKSFDDIVRALDEDDLSVIKGFVINTIRAEQEPRNDDEVLQVSVAGTLEALRAFARVMAD